MQKKRFNKQKLRDALYQYARETFRIEKLLVDTKEIMSAAEKLEPIAMNHAGFISDCYRDPNVVTRAIWWLAETQVGGAGQRSPKWLDDQLESLLELVCPKNTPSKKSIGLLSEIEQGIREMRGELKDIYLP